METKKEEKRIFPEELNHFEELFKEAKARIKAIDLELQNTRPDRGPQLTFRPPNYSNPNYSQNNAQKVSRLNQEKYQIQIGFNERLEKELVNLEPKQVQKIMEMIDYEFSDNEYKNLDDQQMKNIKGDVKDVKSSFNYMASLHYKQFSSEKTKESEPAPNETEKSDVHAKNTPESFISQYKYPQAKDFDENTKDIIDKEKESEPSKSEITKSDPQSKNMPESFMAQYELPKPKDFSENSKDVAEKKKLDMDKDRD